MNIFLMVYPFSSNNDCRDFGPEKRTVLDLDHKVPWDVRLTNEWRINFPKPSTPRYSFRLPKGIAVMKPIRGLAGIAILLMGVGCSTVTNQPFNQPTADTNAGLTFDPAAAAGQQGRAAAVTRDDTIIGLAFSGGGTRAAAFSFGVLRGLDKTSLKGHANATLLDRVDFVSGVSGGSVLAAYFGLK